VVGVSAPSKVYIQLHHWQEMEEDVSQRAPEEACGLVAGVAGRSLGVYPVTNVYRSPVCFRLAPEEQLRLLVLFDAQNWDLLAIYHSHPFGPSHPSPTDVEEARYPEAVNLIWYRGTDGWCCRAFVIAADTYREVAMELE
jgi:proteasome lid subunit RPN8/RPN11